MTIYGHAIKHRINLIKNMKKKLAEGKITQEYFNGNRAVIAKQIEYLKLGPIKNS